MISLRSLRQLGTLRHLTPASVLSRLVSTDTSMALDGSKKLWLLFPLGCFLFFFFGFIGDLGIKM